jgi:hypothetical protein
MLTSNAYALDVNNKSYYLRDNDSTVITFQQSILEPGSNGFMYISVDNVVHYIYGYHQNSGDSIVNLGEIGVFYQSPTDVLTFIPPTYLVFKPITYLVH